MQMQRTLNEQGNTLMELCLTDMREMSRKAAQERGAPCTIVPIVLYTDPQFDLTDDVIARLNANKPKDKKDSKVASSNTASTAKAANTKS